MPWATLNCLCRLISDHQLETTGSAQLTPVLRLMAGAGAGIVAMSATYPLDMVRGRLTVQEGRNVQYSGIVHATRTILREVSCATQGGPKRRHQQHQAAGRQRQQHQAADTSWLLALLMPL
jgi:hypothetical protein